MAPKVCVPADFGRHHIGAPSHGNLTFNLGEGVQIKANSIILSLNSPVIDDLTTNLHLTSLEAEDFSREAVDCFIEASYTGEIEAVTVGNFRDVNKMSRVFDVSWLVARCEEYFVSYLDKLDSESNYPDILFAVEEAVYLLSTVKKRDFLELVVKKMTTIAAATRDSFIKEYLINLSTLSTCKLDACLAIMSSSVQVLVESLVIHLEKPENNNFDHNSRYLLKNLDMSLCFDENPEIHTRLFAVLRDLNSIAKEDFQLLLDMHQKVTSRKAKGPVSNSLEPVSNSPSPVLKLGSFKAYMSEDLNFDTVFEMFAARTDIDNLYEFFDGIWSRIVNIKCESESQVVVRKIVDLKNKRNWSKIHYRYVEAVLNTGLTPPHAKLLLESLRNCAELVSRAHDADFHMMKIKIMECLPSEFVQKMFCENSDIKFEIPDLKFADRTFILSTTPMHGNKPDSFGLKWGLFDSDDMRQTNSQPRLHFALERHIYHNVFMYPLTWCGKPTCDETKTYWNWGYIKFHDETVGELNMLESKEGSMEWKFKQELYNEQYKVKLVCFVIT